MLKKMEHARYQRALRYKTDSELRFIARDAKEAIDAMPDNPNNSYYADEIAYAAMERFKRTCKGYRQLRKD
jgi:hypothetical protein